MRQIEFLCEINKLEVKFMKLDVLLIQESKLDLHFLQMIQILKDRNKMLQHVNIIQIKIEMIKSESNEYVFSRFFFAAFFDVHHSDHQTEVMISVVDKLVLHLHFSNLED